MKKMYRASYGVIGEFEVVKETTKTIVFLISWSGDKLTECTNRKTTECHMWFNTWNEAHHYLIKTAIAKVDSAEKIVIFADKELEKIEALTNPNL